MEINCIYEVGCGNGYITEFIKSQYPAMEIGAMDIEAEKIAIAKTRVHGVDFTVGTIYEINKPNDSVDLVLSTEVLEHLENPLDALKELVRVSRRYIIISVPNEPLWRMANIARLKYLSTFGNTPGHINHWSKRAFRAFAEQVCLVRTIHTPFPFTILLCEKNGVT